MNVSKFQKMRYFLHGRNASIAGKQYPKMAGQIVNRLNRLKNIFANPETAVTEQNIKHKLKQLVQVAGYIEHELSNRQNATKGNMFFGLGARDESTAELYREIVRDLKIMTDSLHAPAASHNLPRHTVTQSLIEDRGIKLI